MAALKAGVDSIEHGTYTDAQTNACSSRSSAWLVPTMVAPHAALAQARAGARSAATLAKAEEAVAAHNENIAKAIRDGVRIAFGTDSGVSDHGKNAKEFALLVKAGMTPAAAIRAATIDAATLLDRADRIGQLEPGKDADIVAVATSPLDDVTVLERVRFVMRQGVVHALDGARQAFPGSNSLSTEGFACSELSRLISRAPIFFFFAYPSANCVTLAGESFPPCLPLFP